MIASIPLATLQSLEPVYPQMTLAALLAHEVARGSDSVYLPVTPLEAREYFGGNIDYEATCTALQARGVVSRWRYDLDGLEGFERRHIRIWAGKTIANGGDVPVLNPLDVPRQCTTSKARIIAAMAISVTTAAVMNASTYAPHGGVPPCHLLSWLSEVFRGYGWPVRSVVERCCSLASNGDGERGSLLVSSGYAVRFRDDAVHAHIMSMGGPASVAC